MATASPFETVIAALRVAFSGAAISEADYRDIFRILRHYDTHRESKQAEREVLTRVGWPTTYHPCDNMEDVRWGCALGAAARSEAVVALCKQYWS